jgi:hypothetical protein
MASLERPKEYLDLRKKMFKYIIKEHENKPLRWWYENREQIDFSPPYQRGGRIWPLFYKEYLIDTILNRYDIPKIYIADFRLGDSQLNKNKKRYAIIDGKQRFEAIFDFFSDSLKIGAHHNFLLEADPQTKLDGLSYSQLRLLYPKIASGFDNYIINVMSIWADKEGFVDSLFVRLNTSIPANGAERRNAIPGLVMRLTRQLADHPFFKTKINFYVKRMADRNVAIQLLLMEYKQRIVNIKKSDLDKFAIIQVNAAAEKQLEAASHRVRNMLDKLAASFHDHDELLSKAGSVPVYYNFIKTVKIQDTDRIRDFLSKFEEKRKENIQKRESGDQNVNNELLGYEQNRRSPGDAKAINGMVDLLIRYFKNG